MTGAITTNSTFDGRDVSVDGAKLDLIEANATADQTGAQIKTAYEAESDTNALTDTLKTKLDGIEASATADQTNEEIQDVVGGMVTGNTESGITVTYEDSDGTLDFTVASQTANDFTNTLKTKLDAIEANATVDQTAAEIRTLVGSATDSNVYDDAAVTKLSGIETSATADQTDEEIQDIVGAMVASNTETGITVTYQDGDGTLDFAVASQTANDFTNTLKTKLDNIEASADVTDTTNVVSALSAGTGVSISGGGEIAVTAVALTTVQTAANQTAHLALTAQEGDIVVRSDENKTYCHNGGSAGTMADYTLLATPTDTVLSVAGNTGAVTAAQIKTAYESNSDTNEFSDAEQTKLSGIAASATIDQTGAEIKTAYEAESSAFTDAQFTKLAGIATSANLYVHPNHSGEVTSTADGATVIADNVVDEANLKISNSPTNGQFLSAQSGNSGGLTWAAVDALPTQSGQAGKFLTTDATDASWATVDALPSQSGNAGKYLTTNATVASWAVLDTDANTTTKGLYEHSHTITANYVMTTGNNALTAGPITINSGIEVTIPSGSTWVIA
jgi:hypothetical protein